MTTVTKNDILKTLTELGIKNGDLVHFHSSLKSMGHVEGGPDAVIDAFLEAVGPEGTVAVPTLSQKNFERAYEDWTLDRPSDVGLITETFRLRKEAKRSDQATHSVAAIGRLAEYITADHGRSGLRRGIFGGAQHSRHAVVSVHPRNRIAVQLHACLAAVGYNLKSHIIHPQPYRNA